MKRKTIKDLDAFRRPREKMTEKGPQALSDEELLAAILGSGQRGRDVFQVAASVQRVVEEKRENIVVDDLRRLPGMGQAKACQVIAALEYSRRRMDPISGKRIREAADVALLAAEYRDRRQEHFLVLTLDGAHRVIARRLVFIGTINSSLIHPREVFVDAISDRAAAVILVHNHPAGQLQPSPQDLAVTERLQRVGEIIGIEVLDHVILTADGFLSFRDAVPSFSARDGEPAE